VREKAEYRGDSRGKERLVEKEVVYSTDPADFAYMAVNVPCQAACPAKTNVPAYIRCLYEGRYGRSYELNRIVNVMPGVLGRVCSRPCELKCRHGEPELGKPVAICHLKRAASDFKEPGHVHIEQLFGPVHKRVCIVGAGPAGLAAAHDLAAVGVSVDLMEAMEHPGGMLRYGIPEFRLPRDLLSREIEGVLRLGVRLRTGVRIGEDIAVERLLQSYDAVLVTAGCMAPLSLGVPGENLPNVLPGLRFVIDVNSGLPPLLGKSVLVLGAGFTAFDCARLALRLGAEDASICVRGLEEELRVTEDEMHEAKKEGVKIRSLLVASEIVGDARAEGVRFVRTRPGPKGPDGRRKPIPIEGSEIVMRADTVIIAVGQRPKPLPGTHAADGPPAADPNTFGAPLDKLYVAGDYLTGPSTVIEAIAAGRNAAERIAEDLLGRKFREWAVRIEEARITDRDRSWDFAPRVEVPTVLPVEDRFAGLEVEAETGYTRESAHQESKRCYLCYLHYEIDMTRCIYCRYCIDAAPRNCIKLVKNALLDDDGALKELVETSDWRQTAAVVIDNSRCIRCGACVRVCPMDCISVSKVELVQRAIAGGGD
jgi:formate dehydrogenase major subunit